MDERSGRGFSGRAAIAAAALTVLCVVALMLIAAAAPEGFQSGLGFSRASAELYRSALGWIPDWRFTSEIAFVWAFRALLLGAWAGWAALLLAAIRRPDGLAWARPAAIGVIVFLTVAAPPIFSTDVFSYVAWSRMMWALDLNPYLSEAVTALSVSSDGSRQEWPRTVAYGPAWTLVVSGLGAAAAPAGLFAEVLVHKALAGAGLWATAAAAARIASSIRPGFGPVTWLAVGFCPLLLVEGPIGGHNDFVAIGLLTWAAALYISRGRPWTDAVLGLALAWKLTAIGVVPLLVLSRWRSGTKAAAISLALCVAPFLLLSQPFGGIMPILQSVSERIGASSSEMTALPVRAGILIASLAWSVWIVLRAKPLPGAAWHEAWVPASLGIVLGTTPVLFPWYFAWTLIPVLTRWDMRHFGALTVVCTLAVLSMWLYAAELP